MVYASKQASLAYQATHSNQSGKATLSNNLRQPLHDQVLKLSLAIALCTRLGKSRHVIRAKRYKGTPP